MDSAKCRREVSIMKIVYFQTDCLCLCTQAWGTKELREATCVVILKQCASPPGCSSRPQADKYTRLGCRAAISPSPFPVSTSLENPHNLPQAALHCYLQGKYVWLFVHSEIEGIPKLETTSRITEVKPQEEKQTKTRL